MTITNDKTTITLGHDERRMLHEVTCFAMHALYDAVRHERVGPFMGMSGIETPRRAGELAEFCERLDL